MADHTQPWAERTVEMPPEGHGPGMPPDGYGPGMPPGPEGFRRGVAQVGVPRTHGEPGTAPHEPTGTGWPMAEQEREREQLPPGYHWRQLRIGRHWSMLGGLFAFVCWGIWAISARGDLTSPVVTFVLTLFVAVGLFALARLVGRVIWERQLGRIRRSAQGAHLVTGIFLAGVGVAYLRQTEWVVDLWNWVAGL
ncbi:hypothetical protein O7626_26195 [Micromonospora sp. WMMD1102]|uniref:hypothetical protein n=1 Tax=Micromonospora sp. WMMD1102 TaxID=3016105 RepID=UPI002414D2AB|nr:hypothetical protein [Micromonospora sp. WMMD1102]MDG4789373.1 hypothetical protein [Micromonospora sp. WMMD1102]